MAKGNPKDVKAQAKADADQEIAWREEKELKKKKQKAAESFQAGSLLYKQRDYAAAVQKLSISISMRPVVRAPTRPAAGAAGAQLARGNPRPHITQYTKQ